MVFPPFSKPPPPHPHLTSFLTSSPRKTYITAGISRQNQQRLTAESTYRDSQLPQGQRSSRHQSSTALLVCIYVLYSVLLDLFVILLSVLLSNLFLTREYKKRNYTTKVPLKCLTHWRYKINTRLFDYMTKVSTKCIKLKCSSSTRGIKTKNTPGDHLPSQADDHRVPSSTPGAS